MNRSSPLIKVARIGQSVASFASFLDSFVAPFFRNRRPFNLIVVLAPPRSGSTISYQVIAEATESLFVPNLWNFLYRYPLVGGSLSCLLRRRHQSNFKSEHGLTTGFSGEAEALKFWNYWLGSSLIESNVASAAPKGELLKNYIERLNYKFQFDTVTAGFLGHVFEIEKLRKLFSPLFVHIIRDPVDNAISIYRVQPRLSSTMFSTIPEACERHYNNRLEQIVDQIHGVHSRVFQNCVQSDTVHIEYEELCDTPLKELNKLESCAKRAGLKLRINAERIEGVPLQKSAACPSDNELRMELQRLFERKGTYALIESKVCQSNADTRI